MVWNPDTKTLAIAGTSSISDVLTDLTIPFHALTWTPRYNEAKSQFELYAPKTVIGHSLGAAIALNLKNDPQISESLRRASVRMYNAPRLAFHDTPDVQSFRHWGDVISIGDRAATSTFGWDPHSYH